MKLAKLITLFLILNFGALALGIWFMNNGPQSTWYMNLNKAPWTPPGWVFGFAWTTIMICFAIYMAYLAKNSSNFKYVVPYALQWLLNVGWNFAFFNQQHIGMGLIIIIALTLLAIYIPITYRKETGNKWLLLLPYSIWLCIATSLNAYILIYN
tara:strand:+ start:11453 stop:11914 length:462 start_codon:yes stop_codon:yes gene_type:complete